MITLKEPIALKSLNNKIKVNRAFNEKIIANYNIAMSKINKEEMLHLLMQGPEDEQNQSAISYISNVSVFNNNEVRINYINQLINRILEIQNGDITFQDKAYITCILNQLGIKNVHEYIRNIKKCFSEMNTAANTLKLYENIVTNMDLEHSSSNYSNYVTENNDVTENANEQEINNNTLYLSIMKRIQEKENTNLVYALNHLSTQVLDTFISNNDLITAEKLYAFKSIDIMNDRQVLTGENPGLEIYTFNPYENNYVHEDEKYENFTAETIKEQVISNLMELIIFHTAKSTAINNYEIKGKENNSWIDINYEICRSAVEAVNRYRISFEEHKQNSNISIYNDAFKKLINTNEIEILSQLVHNNFTFENNTDKAETNFIEADNNVYQEEQRVTQENLISQLMDIVRLNSFENNINQIINSYSTENKYDDIVKEIKNQIVKTFKNVSLDRITVNNINENNSRTDIYSTIFEDSISTFINKNENKEYNENLVSESNIIHADAEYSTAENTLLTVENALDELITHNYAVENLTLLSKALQLTSYNENRELITKVKALIRNSVNNGRLIQNMLVKEYLTKTEQKDISEENIFEEKNIQNLNKNILAESIKNVIKQFDENTVIDELFNIENNKTSNNSIFTTEIKKTSSEEKKYIVSKLIYLSEMNENILSEIAEQFVGEYKTYSTNSLKAPGNNKKNEGQLVNEVITNIMNNYENEIIYRLTNQAVNNSQDNVTYNVSNSSTDNILYHSTDILNELLMNINESEREEIIRKLDTISKVDRERLVQVIESLSSVQDHVVEDKKNKKNPENITNMVNNVIYNAMSHYTKNNVANEEHINNVNIVHGNGDTEAYTSISQDESYSESNTETTLSSEVSNLNESMTNIISHVFLEHVNEEKLLAESNAYINNIIHNSEENSVLRYYQEKSQIINKAADTDIHEKINTVNNYNSSYENTAKAYIVYENMVNEGNTSDNGVENEVTYVNNYEERNINRTDINEFESKSNVTQKATDAYTTNNIQEIQQLVKENMQKEVRSITDMVYQKIEKKLQNERKRRGI